MTEKIYDTNPHITQFEATEINILVCGIGVRYTTQFLEAMTPE